MSALEYAYNHHFLPQIIEMMDLQVGDLQVVAYIPKEGDTFLTTKHTPDGILHLYTFELKDGLPSLVQEDTTAFELTEELRSFSERLSDAM